MIELLFDNEFGLSGSEISEEERKTLSATEEKRVQLRNQLRTLEANQLVVIQASLWMNPRAIVKEQLEILWRGR